MSLPAGWSLVEVTGTFVGSDGAPLRGSITFCTPSPVIVGGVVVIPREITARLDANGSFSIQLPSTNDPDLSVVGWAYTVIEDLEGGRAPYALLVPYNSSGIDLSDIDTGTPDPVTTNPYLRQSDIGQTVASEQAVEDAQADADAAAATAASAQSAANTHAARTDNPHATTAAQVGAIPATEKGAANGVATLGGDGKIPIGQVPKIAVTDVFVVNSEAAQLALVAEEGDYAKRTDFAPARSYIHNGGTSGTMADWTETEQPDLAAHEAAPDPHPGYVLESALGQAGSPPPLNAAARLDPIYRAKKRATVAPVAGVLTLDLSTLDDAYIALSANVTSTAFSNGPPDGWAREGTLVFVQDATGGRTWTPPAGSKWPNGLAAVLTSTANAVDHIGYRVYNNGGTLEYTFYPVRDVR